MKKSLLSAGLGICLGFWSGCAGDAAHRSTGEVIDDGAITTKLKAALVKDPEIHGMKVAVTVDKGVVTLSGPAQSEHERKKAEEMAWGINGVKAVQNNLVLVK